MTLDKNGQDEAIYSLRTEISGDDAILFEVLKVRLGIKEKSKKLSDRRLIEVALKSLEASLDEYQFKSGKRFPTESELSNHLVKKGEQLKL